MIFGQIRVDYCCSSMEHFLHKVETVFRRYNPNDAPIYCGVNIISGYYDFEIDFCPFCGEKIIFDKDFE